MKYRQKGYRDDDLFDYNRYNFGDFRDENTFRFGITLANIRSFGTSLGGASVY